MTSYDHAIDDRTVGFTLIELSIVLVIIGLVVGGVLVGRDLISAATLRAQISQIEKFNTASHVFKVKYNDLPGDITPAGAAAFGMATRTGTMGQGDADRIIRSGYNNNYASGAGVAGEVMLFWNDLSAAGLIEGSFTVPACESSSFNCTLADPHTVIPTSRLGPNSYVTVYGDPSDGRNYFQLIDDVTSIGPVGTFLTALFSNGPLTPIQASGIDTKMDDGRPLTGNVTARDVTYSMRVNWVLAPAPATPAAPSFTICVSNAPGNPYNADPSTGGNQPYACSLRMPLH